MKGRYFPWPLPSITGIQSPFFQGYFFCLFFFLSTFSFKKQARTYSPSWTYFQVSLPVCVYLLVVLVDHHSFVLLCSCEHSCCACDLSAPHICWNGRHQQCISSPIKTVLQLITLGSRCFVESASQIVKTDFLAKQNKKFHEATVVEWLKVIKCHGKIIRKQIMNAKQTVNGRLIKPLFYIRLFVYKYFVKVK